MSAQELKRDLLPDADSGVQILGNTVTVTVDRPLGTAHPRHPDILYPVNYGYVPRILAPDGEEQDAYILGVDRPVEVFSGKVIAIIHRWDDVEEKWVVAPEGLRFTKAEIESAVSFQERYFQSEIISMEGGTG